MISQSGVASPSPPVPSGTFGRAGDLVGTEEHFKQIFVEIDRWSIFFVISVILPTHRQDADATPSIEPAQASVSPAAPLPERREYASTRAVHLAAPRDRAEAL